MKENITLKKEHWNIRSTGLDIWPYKEFEFRIKCKDKYIIDRILCLDKYYKNSLQYRIVHNSYWVIYMWEQPKHDIDIIVYLKHKNS